ncbi:MAG TPA: hypothetical protein VGM58_09360, partial [Verrucomicrobiae bacterium]
SGAKTKIKDAIIALSKKSPLINVEQRQKSFDQWHSDLCNALKIYYDALLGQNTKIRLTYGQAQKWVNMTLKYCWVCGVAASNDLTNWFSAAHVAVDEIILLAAQREKVIIERPCRKWSVWDSQQQYEVFQKLLRDFSAKQNKTPLELEFDWWLKYRSEVIGFENDEKVG